MGGKGRVNILRSRSSNSVSSSTSSSKNLDSKLPCNEAGGSLNMTSFSNVNTSDNKSSTFINVSHTNNIKSLMHYNLQRNRVRLVKGKILRVGAKENESSGGEQDLKIIGNGKNKSYNAPAFRPKWKPRHVVDHKGTFLHFIA